MTMTRAEAFEWFCLDHKQYDILAASELLYVSYVEEESGFHCDYCGAPAEGRHFLDESLPQWSCSSHHAIAEQEVRSRWAFKKISTLDEEPDMAWTWDEVDAIRSTCGPIQYDPERAKTDEPNPKDLLGIKKPPNLSVIPTSALIHMGRAMADGGEKYGPFNWREHPVRSGIYVDAAVRHLAAWQDGEEDAEDSGVHHLGHAMACLAILLDAQEVGNLIDERVPGPMAEMVKRYTRE
jgi:hypothetical protein